MFAFNKDGKISMNKEQILKIASLARIKLSQHELDQYQDLNHVIRLIDKINLVNTENVEPMSHPLPEVVLNSNQSLRTDEITEFNERENLQKIAPGKIEAGLYLVPEVFE